MSFCCEQSKMTLPLAPIRLENLERICKFSNKDFPNVSLVSGNQKVFKTHKIILSAASPFLKSIFLDNSDSECLIILPDYGEDLISEFLTFIQTGETRVKQSNLETFQNICNEFLIDNFETSADIKEKGEMAKEEKFQLSRKCSLKLMLFHLRAIQRRLGKIPIILRSNQQ